MATGFVDSNRGGTRRASRCWGPANFSPPRRRHRHDEPRTSIWTWWRLHLALHGHVRQAGAADTDRDYGCRTVVGRFGVVRRGFCGLFAAASSTHARCGAVAFRGAGWLAATGDPAWQRSIRACGVGGLGGFVQPQVPLSHWSWPGSRRDDIAADQDGSDGGRPTAGACPRGRQHHGGLASGAAAVDRPVAQGPGAQRRTCRACGAPAGERIFTHHAVGSRPTTCGRSGAQRPSGGGTQTCPRTQYLVRKQG